MKRIIFHSDMNAFYASVEQAERPELRGKPVIVAGDPNARHGIVLTASYEAKRRGVKTAMALWEARLACPEALVVAPRYELYLHYSRLARQIYYDYTDQVEAFGLDECWLDLTNTIHLHGNDALLVAREISERIRSELGVSISIGVSWNKIFAKFGSDYDKPDGLTLITPETMKTLVWPSDVGKLLYVGRATTRKLKRLGIITIGELAHTDTVVLRRTLGKMGVVLQEFARGHDDSPVRTLTPDAWRNERPIKSVGNGITMPFDACDERTIRQVVWLMGESVAQRLRASGLQAKTVGVHARYGDTLASFTRQTSLERPSQITSEICQAAADLLVDEWRIARLPLRSIGVRASNLVSTSGLIQLDLFGTEARRQKYLQLDRTIDDLRHRFGNSCIRRLGELSDARLQTLDPERDNVVHPVSFFA